MVRSNRSPAQQLRIVACACLLHLPSFRCLKAGSPAEVGRKRGKAREGRACSPFPGERPCKIKLCVLRVESIAGQVRLRVMLVQNGMWPQLHPSLCTSQASPSWPVSAEILVLVRHCPITFCIEGRITQWCLFRWIANMCSRTCSGGRWLKECFGMSRLCFLGSSRSEF